MKRFNNVALMLTVSAALASCASHQPSISKYRELVHKKDFDKALEMMKSNEIYADKESELLKFLELGTLHMHKAEYFQALKYFDAARDLSDKLFTVSLSKKVTSTIGSAESDNYYGEKYERSLIRYYTILAHYNLYDNGKYEAFKVEKKDKNGKVIEQRDFPEVAIDDAKKRFHFQAAKSVLLEWNSILEDLKATHAGEVTYKDDLLAKFVGAIIHEKADTSNDRQIALGLYKEAVNTNFRYYNSLESFNKKFSAFNADYEKLPSLETQEIRKNYVLSTPTSTAIEDYSAEKVKGWNAKEQDNIYVIWHDGFVAPKVAVTHKFPLVVDKMRTPAAAGGDFIAFTNNILKVQSSIVPAIEFEMVSVPYKATQESVKFIVKQNGIIVDQKESLLIDPVSEFAHHALTSRAKSDMMIKGSRVVSKHVGAIGAAYLTYTQSKAKVGEGMALMAASGVYGGLSRAIASTEKADIRSWSTLPNQVRMNSFKLPPGTYELYAINEITKEEKSVGSFEVKKDKKLNLKTFF